MTCEYRHWADPAIARTYIRTLAMSFEDPTDMSTFLNLCDIAQAALVRCSVEEILSENEVEISLATKTLQSDEPCHQALQDLNITKEKLKELLVKKKLVAGKFK